LKKLKKKYAFKSVPRRQEGDSKVCGSVWGSSSLCNGLPNYQIFSSVYFRQPVNNFISEKHPIYELYRARGFRGFSFLRSLYLVYVFHIEMEESQVKR